MTSFTIDTPNGPLRMAIFLKAHNRLCAVGMNPPRGTTKRQILDKTTAITSKSYKRGEHGKAAEDLDAYIKQQLR